MARPSNTDERRLQIMGALVKVMAKRGYDGASSPTSPGGPAHARAGPLPLQEQAEILLAALHDLVARRDASLEARLGAAEGDAIAELTAFIDFHLGLGADADPEALACWILLSGEALREPRVRVEFEEGVAGENGASR
jgi:TetR/AcrR family transcriptional repressor of bet genes